MKRESVYPIVAVILFATYVLYHGMNNSKQHFYGNNEEMIIETIHSIKGYENQAVVVLKKSDISDTRVVGILTDDHPGYITFKRNKRGDYEWNQIQMSVDGSTLGFYLPDMDQGQKRKILIVTNQNNDIAKLSVTINGQLMEQAIRPMQNNVIWIDLPKSDSGEYRFDDYRYYDNSNQQIKL